MVCMLLLVMLKLMRGHVPPSYHDMPTSMRVSCGLVWTATTGEGPSGQGPPAPAAALRGLRWQPGQVAMAGQVGYLSSEVPAAVLPVGDSQRGRQVRDRKEAQVCAGHAQS